MSRRPTTVLLTGSGIGGGPDIIRALRADPVLEARIVGVDSNPDQPSRYLADAFHTVPPRNEPGYVESVARIAESEGARVIYPLPAFDQEIFAGAREGLEARGFAVPVSPEPAARTCNDKWLLYERVRASAPSLVPETSRVSSAEELTEAARSLGYPTRRACIRRRISRGAIGLRVLDAGPARLTALLEENPGSLLISLDEVLDTLGQAETFPDYLVQEYLPGEEWDVDVLCNDGDSVVLVTRRNLAMTGGGALRSVLEPQDEVAESARALIADLGLNAIVNVSFRSDADDRLKLLEINPRIPSSVASGQSGGVNLVGLAVRQALGERIEPLEPAWGGTFMLHFQSALADGAGRAITPPAAAPSRTVPAAGGPAFANTVCLTLDVDWAPEPVLQATVDRLQVAGVPATFFATHASEVLTRAEGDQFEIGLHPNFNDCDGDFEQPLASVKRAYPNAIGGRSHSLFVSSHILELYMRHGLRYESNVFLLGQEGLEPVPRFEGLLSIPFNWSDDKHFELGLPFESGGVGLDKPGLKVLNFHPIHLFANTRGLDHYWEYRSHQTDPAALEPFVNTEGPGVSTLFDQVIEEISSRGLVTMRMADLANESTDGSRPARAAGQ